jgi:NADP-dependent 3-hydroxy acid dehydrogenase YdfG
MMTKLFQGTTALGTGTDRGIGQAVTLRSANASDTMAVFTRSTDQQHPTTAPLHATHILVSYTAIDGPLSASTTIDPDDWAAALAVNVTAVAGLTFTQLPTMLNHKRSRVNRRIQPGQARFHDRRQRLPHRRRRARDAPREPSRRTGRPRLE